MKPILSIVAALVASSALLCADEKLPPKFELKLKPVKLAEGDSELRKLQKERYNAALKVVEFRMVRIEVGSDTVAGLKGSFEQLVEAGLEVFTAPKDRIELFEHALEAAKEAEQIIGLQVRSGAVSSEDLEQARYVRLTTEIRLLKEKERGKK